MTFLSAAFLFGLILASVPIIIHILNRRRFQVIDWPPMKYLKLTLKKNRRRIRMEQLILLAMRTLAVILLILAVARPVLSQNGLSRLFPGRARTSRVIVIDDSLSMGYTTAGRSAFQLAQNAAADLIRAAGGQDNLTLMISSAPETPLLRNAGLQDRAKYADMVGTLSVTDTPGNWSAVFGSIQMALGAATFSSREVILITDLRRSGWSSDVTPLANKLAADHVPLRIIDVGDRRTENVSLQDFAVEDAVALPLQPIHLRARVHNGTANTITSGQATLSVNGDNRPVLLPNMPPGTSTDVPLTVSLENPGVYSLALTLAKDALPQDDARYLTLTVRPTLTVLLIDGEPSGQPFESETDFLTLAYTIGAQPWSVQRVTEFDPRRYRPGSADIPDVMVLANVAALAGEQAAGLEQLVQNGMGLMIFTGELVDAEAYNQRLYREGKGLLPMRLLRSSETPTAGLVVEKDPQSALAPLAKLAPEALARIRTRRYSDVEKNAVLPEDVRVLAHWNNAENPPAILHKPFGRGQVILFTTTAGRKWTDWPLDATYVLAVRSTALAIARTQGDGDLRIAGEPIQVRLEPGQVALDPRMMIPSAAAPETVEADRFAADTPLLRYARTFHSGFYALSWRDEKAKPVIRRFAVNPPPAESDLELLSESQLAALMGNLQPALQRYDTSGVGLTTPPREIWRPLALILLGLLAIETVFAVWVGRER